MLKRIIDAWPYALALAVGLAVWPLAISAVLGSDPSQVMGAIVLWVYILQPLALLVGGIVLGFRRGFDGVTILVCLAVYVLGFAVLGLFSNDPEFFVSYAGPSTLAFFLPAVVAGTGIGVGLRSLSRRTGVAGNS